MSTMCTVETVKCIPYFNFLSLWHYSLKYASPIDLLSGLKKDLIDKFQIMKGIYSGDCIKELNDFSPHLFKNFAEYSENSCYWKYLSVSATEEEIKEESFLLDNIKKTTQMEPIMVECNDKIIKLEAFPKKASQGKLTYYISIVFCRVNLVPCALLFSDDDNIVVMMHGVSLTLGKCVDSSYKNFFDQRDVIILAAVYFPMRKLFTGNTRYLTVIDYVFDDNKIEKMLKRDLKPLAFDEEKYMKETIDLLINVLESPYTYYTMIGMNEDEAYKAINIMYYFYNGDIKNEERPKIWSYFNYVEFLVAFNKVLVCYKEGSDDLLNSMENLVRLTPFYFTKAKEELLTLIAVIASDKSIDLEKRIQELLGKVFTEKEFTDIVSSLPAYMMNFMCSPTKDQVKMPIFVKDFRENYKWFLEKKEKMDFNRRYIDLKDCPFLGSFINGLLDYVPSQLYIIP